MALWTSLRRERRAPAGTSTYRPVITLDQAPRHTPLQLVAINSGRKLTLRLAEMGLLPGTEITIIQNSRGPILLSVRGSRVAVGRGVAMKCEVHLPANSLTGESASSTGTNA